ncbi:hypothetical protein C8R47DRAFT_1230479 [Mycena vitilis]|nr:hypothetical protein C8R47DRAFT_1230479 [Mycena vitilis]
MADLNALAAYVHGCRSLCAPIRRLPLELLSDIFEICSVSQEKYAFESLTLKDELERVSKGVLLRLSQVGNLRDGSFGSNFRQVSLHWHTTVMGTPKLWSRIFCDTTLWRDPSADPYTLLSLLESSLTRAKNHPLTIEVVALDGDPCQEAVLSLISLHARRWKTLYISSDFTCSQYMISAKGNLDCLKVLHVCAEWNTVDIFQIAPRLEEFAITGGVEHIPVLPWAQIRKLICVGQPGTDPIACFLLLRHSPAMTECTLDLNLRKVSVESPWPPLSSDIRALWLQLDVSNVPAPRSRGLGHAFQSLTLPCLEFLAVMPRREPAAPTGGGRVPPVWASSDFLGLAKRSSFQTHLTSLQVDAAVSDEGLLRCLSVLPRLEKLIVREFWGCEPAPLTDRFFQSLSSKQSVATVVPGLKALALTSTLRFADIVLLAFVASRLPAQDESFAVYLRWTPRRHRDLSTELLEMIGDLECGGACEVQACPD